MENNKQAFLKWFDQWLAARPNVERREYQPDKIWEIIDTDVPKFVLAAAPNSGKTLMSIIYMDWRYHNNINYRAVVLTHGIDELRRQFRERAKEFNANFLSSDNIIIDLPHSVRYMDIGDIDDLLVDEAHHFYFAADGMIAKIIEHTNPKHQLLLTGTPSDFIMHNKLNSEEQFYISYIDLYTLHQLGHTHNVVVEVASTTYDFSIKDYTADGELQKKMKFEEGDIRATCVQMMNAIMDKLQSQLRGNPKLHKMKTMIVGRDLNFLRSKVGKTMIVCRTITEATFVNRFLVDYGYEANNILQSTSDNMQVKDLESFKTDPNITFAIVVYRGILGFDYADLQNIIDLTASRNVNRNLQLYCRLVRTCDTHKKKLYYKIVPTDLVYYFEKFMAGVLHLSHQHFLEQFDGKNFMDLPIIPVERTKKEPCEPGKKGKSGRTNLVQLDLEYVFSMIPLWHKGDSVLDSKAYITLNDVMIELGYASKNWMSASEEEILAELKRIKETESEI